MVERDRDVRGTNRALLAITSVGYSTPFWTLSLGMHAARTLIFSRPLRVNLFVLPAFATKVVVIARKTRSAPSRDAAVRSMWFPSNGMPASYVCVAR